MRGRPILFSAPMIRAILAGRKSQTRRLVKERGPLLWDLSRARADQGFPNSNREYKNGYLHVPFANSEDGWEKNPEHDTRARVCCPYGVAGDRLWVKHEHWHKKASDLCPERVWDPFTEIVRSRDYAGNYEDQRCGFESLPGDFKKRSSLFLPRWASRLTLELLSVRAERLQDITEVDAVAEGVETHAQKYGLPEAKLHGTTPWYRYDDKPCAAVSAVESYRTLWESINGPGSWARNDWVWRLEFAKC